MSITVKEIIDVAKKYSDASRKAREYGIIGVYEFNTFQIHTEDEFRNLAYSSLQEIAEITREDTKYPYEYSIEIDGLKFFTISEKPLYFKNSDMEIVEEIKL
jgi:hypothetical protein